MSGSGEGHSRRRFLAGVGALGVPAFTAGCLAGEGEIELVTEREFELTDRDLVRNGIGFDADGPIVGADLVSTGRAYEERFVPDAWPESVDRATFDETDFAGDEFLVVVEAALPEGGNVTLDDREVHGGRLWYTGTLSPCSGSPTSLYYRVQKWRRLSRSRLDGAAIDQTCSE